jgi:aspartate/tyrosine/aromatic aminotransferase
MDLACSEEGQRSVFNGEGITFNNTQADELLRQDPNLNHEYLPIAGLPDFTTASQKLVIGGDNPAIKEKRVSSNDLVNNIAYLLTQN